MPIRLAAALIGLAALGGCGTVNSWTGGLFGSSSGGSSEQPPAACPNTAILKPLSQTAVFAPGAAAQPPNVGFYGILSDADVKCDRVGDALRASLDIVVIGERGPAAGKADSLDLQYFVAVTGPNQAIISKRTLPVHIAVPSDVRRAGITDHIVEMIPLAGRQVGDLSIMVGFQQPPEVVDFYRHFRGR